jgi:DNA-binding response OmpR family regulator
LAGVDDVIGQEILPVPDPPNPCLTGCRVLVVEDEYFIANDLEKALRDNGAEVIGPISQLSDAMRLVDDGGFDVAVIDLNLHDELAYPVAEELERQQIPFVFATGYDARVLPSRYGHVPRWQKPFEPAMIVTGLKPLCERAAKKLVPIDPKG